MPSPDNPTGKIQLPTVFATLFVLIFAGLSHMVLTVGVHRHPEHAASLCISALTLGYVMGRCLHELSRDDRLTTGPVRITALARVHRLPTTWATQVAPPGKLQVFNALPCPCHGERHHRLDVT